MSQIDPTDPLFLIALIVKLGEQMSAEMDSLKAAVARMTTAKDSILALVHTLADQIVALKADPAALQALADELKADADAINAAVAANVPPAP